MCHYHGVLASETVVVTLNELVYVVVGLLYITGCEPLMGACLCVHLYFSLCFPATNKVNMQNLASSESLKWS